MESILFPSWLAREKARNLENLKQEQPDSVLWKSWSKCALAATKSILIAIRNARIYTADWAEWRLCVVQSTEHLRQEFRRSRKQWQARYYSEARKLGSLISGAGVISDFQMRAFSEVSRMTKFLSAKTETEYTGPKTWSVSSHRAVTKIRYFLKERSEPDPWLANFRRTKLLNAEFQKKDPWMVAFWTIRESIADRAK